MRVINKCWSLAPSRILAGFFSTVCSSGISLFLVLFFYRTALDYAVESPPPGRIIGFLALSACVFAVLFGYNSWFEQVFKQKSNQRIKEDLTAELFNVTEKLPVERYEDSEFYNDYLLIMREYPDRFIGNLDLMQAIVGLAFSVLSFSGFLMYMDATPLVFVPVIVGLVFVLKLAAAKLQFKRSMKRIRDEKVIEYIRRIVYLPQYAKELRTTPVFGIGLEYMRGAIVGLKKTTEEYGARIGVLSFLSEFFGFYFPLLFAAFYMVYSIYTKGTLGIADYTAAALALSNIVRMLVFAIDIVTRLFENSQYLKKAFSFMSVPPSASSTGSPVPAYFSSLEAESLSFKYKSQQSEFLKNISITLKRGQKVALVGENGSGKSTLVKLLLRFYAADAGVVRLNGVPAQGYDEHAYREYIGTLFQDFQLYATSIRHNIAMGSAIPDKKILECLDAVGMRERIAKLPGGLDTVCSKEFDADGVVFSGGEAQRIALARLYAHDHPVMILDEPSSALDPVLEKQLFDMIYGMKEKAVLFISHRLSCTVSADYIYVMRDGAIAESGTHSELMEKRGYYYELFNHQASIYLDGENT